VVLLVVLVVLVVDGAAAGDGEEEDFVEDDGAGAGVGVREFGFRGPLCVGDCGACEGFLLLFGMKKSPSVLNIPFLVELLLAEPALM